jgi:hypothetical protein
MSCHFFIYEKVSQTTFVKKHDPNFLNTLIYIKKSFSSINNGGYF